MQRRILNSWEWFSTNFMGRLAILLFAVGLVICLIEVFRRYMMDTSFLWSTEIITYLMVVASFFFMGIVLKQGGHIRLILFSRLLPRKAQQALDVLANIGGILFCAILLSGAVALIRTTFQTGSTTPNARLPMYIVDTILSLGLLLLGLRFIQETYRNIRELLGSSKKEGGTGI